MNIWHRHPSDAALARFADSQYDDKGSPRLRRHLAWCQACRNHVAFMRSLPDQVALLSEPEVSEELLSRVRARSATGERVILPVAGGRESRRPYGTWAAAAAVLIAVVGGWLVWPTQDLAAGAMTGELRFTPGRIIHQPMEVRYRAAGLFGDSRRLVLRARYRTRDGVQYSTALRQRTVATLERMHADEFRATLTIPDSVIYAVFAVETEDGARIDDNAHQLWNLMDRDSTGRATFDAMTQRSHDLQGENIELAMRELQERARLFGDRPEAWGAVVGIERFMLGDAHFDSTGPAHCARLARFDALYRRRFVVTPAEAGGIAAYAVQLDEHKCTVADSAGAYWGAWLRRDSSQASETRERHYFAQRKALRDDPARVLALVEQNWPARGEFGEFLYNNGFYFARQAHDSVAILRWADRYAEHTPTQAHGIYAQLLQDSLVRQSALERLRTTLRSLRTQRDSLRPLERTRLEQAREDSASARSVLASIGDGLIEDGKIAAGLDSLTLATQDAWDPALFRRVAETMLKHGDTTAARSLLARIVVDPSTSAQDVDSLSRVGSNGANHADWDRLVGEAARAMRETILAHAVNLGVSKVPRLRMSDGRVTDLRTLAGGKITVIVFWSRFCGYSRQQFPTLPALAKRLETQGIALLPITGESPSEGVRAYLATTKVDVPTYHDTWGEAGRAFQVYGTPAVFIVDRMGRLRFRRTTLAMATTQAIVLKTADDAMSAR